MKRLLSLPPSIVPHFHSITGLDPAQYFCTSDPEGQRVGSGGGTAWLLHQAHKAEAPDTPMGEWLRRERRILIHAGGQSRRLPAYAPIGKLLTPLPVMRWSRGQRINQTLLDMQLPLYEEMMAAAPEGLHTMVVSGDMLVRKTQPLQRIPEADIVCYGLWADPALAAHHGVFYLRRDTPSRLDFMLQKPSVEEQARLMPTHYGLMDIGIWLLSDRAVERLMGKCGTAERPTYYDLYTAFGGALGQSPSQPDAALADLSVAILPLQGGEFYHFGTTPELLSSSLALQNLVLDQRVILKMGIKQQSSVFTQNAIVERRPDATNENIWIENAHVPETWHYSQRNVITGVPRNNWTIALPPGVCVDIVPVGESEWCIRPYGYDDAFRGNFFDPTTRYLGGLLRDWLAARGIGGEEKSGPTDLQDAPIFPVVSHTADIGRWLSWMISPTPSKSMVKEYLALPRLSADQIMQHANLSRLTAQREAYRKSNLTALAKNWRRSIFYQTDLATMRSLYAAADLPLPEPVGDDAPLMTRIHDAVLRGDDAHAFSLLREGLLAPARAERQRPQRTTYDDQIVWGRSPVRIDLAGGWTDTPPYCLYSGGAVVNVAALLNDQPPLQAYVKPTATPHIICRSIDLGAEECITTYDELRAFTTVGSPFSIPKAALALCGFLPEYCAEAYPSLRHQLEDMGGGIEITLLSAVPAGSGLGTSSILAATVLGALSDFCGLGWDKTTIADRTIMLEQLLTTGGGWQDQYGGVLPGVKLLQTHAGFDQKATARYLPDTLFTSADTHDCHLLYYTGLRRTAKHILAEIVRGMFLNSSTHLALLGNMRDHALHLFDTMQMGDFAAYGKAIRTTWQQNCLLDSGTNPPIVARLCAEVDDLCTGYKLPGAGGGGFLYMVAKDPEAATRIRRLLHDNPLTPCARFVKMDISTKGLQISRS